MSMEVGMESVPMWKRPVEALSSEGVKELHRLQAENAKLRDELDRMTEAVEALHSVPLEDQLVQALNVADKLRELVLDMWFWSYCGHIDNEPKEVQMNHIDSVVERMRELGVEQWASS